MIKKIVTIISVLIFLIITMTVVRLSFSNQSIEPVGLADLANQGKFDCGAAEVRDSDGNLYPTVVVGTQCWMAKNIYTGIMMPSGKLQSDNKVIEKYCYNNDEKNCSTDGGLYDLGEAMQYNFLTKGTKGICPIGWHIPTDKEWYTLENYLKNSGQTCDETRVMFMKNKEKRNDTEFDCLGAGTQMKLGGGSGLNIPLAGTAIGNNADLLCEGTCPPSTYMKFMGRSESIFLWTSSQIGSRMLWSDGSIVDGMVAREEERYGPGSVRCIKD